MAFTESGVTLTSYFALKSDWSPYLQLGGVLAVGNNSYGQLGLYNATNISSPIAVVGGAGWLDAAVLRNGFGTTFVSDEGSVYFSGILPLTHRYSPLQVGALNDWNTVVASAPQNILALKNNGTLWSWGNNSFGNLGLSDRTHRSSPVQVGLLSNWSQISSQGYSAAAIKTDGTLWSWGLNTYGQLGILDRTDRSSPVQVGVGSDWYQVSCGYYTTFAVKTDGTLWAWGRNENGELGLNINTIGYSSPVQVGNLSDWNKITSSTFRTFAIKTDGTLWAWGLNNSGELGINTSLGVSSPVQVGTLNNWNQISAQSQNQAAIKTDGTLWAWGLNSYGQLGTSNLTNRSSPVQVGTESDWYQVSCGALHTAAVKTNGTLWSWGLNSFGQLGSSNQTNRNSPVQIGLLSNWSKVSSNFNHTLAIGTNEYLWSWGNNSFGQLGLNYFSNQSFPLRQFLGSFKKVTTSSQHSYFQDFDGQITQYSTEDIPLIDPTVSWSTYDTGLNHFVGIKTNGTAWSIGNNSYGQLGYDNFSPWTEISAGASVKYAINTNGTLWVTGDNDWGQWGLNTLGSATSTPIQVGTLSNWSKIVSAQESAKFWSVLAIKTDGTLWTWGGNDFGKLGLSDGTDRSSPTQIGTLSNWSKISIHDFAAAAIKTDGTLWVWGGNSFGQLGLSDVTHRSSPTQVGTESNWSQVSCGSYATAAVKTDGTLWTWGNNTVGQLGLFDTTRRFSPVQVGSLNDWNQISFSGYSLSAIKTDGTLWTWGDNQSGQLGTSNTTNTNSPVQVGTESYWSQISMGMSASNEARVYSLAIKTDGTLWSWGYNDIRGNLGLNTTSGYSSPMQVGTLNNWTKVSAGGISPAGLRDWPDSRFYSWGGNLSGELGALVGGSLIPIQITINSLQFTSLTQIGYNTNWTKAIAADYGSMLIDNSYNAFVFGENDTYQLGLSDTTNRSSPVQITYTPVITASMDERNIWLIDANNNIWQSGVDNNNYFGIGLTQRVTPVQVGSLSNWSQINLGYTHSLSIKTDGTLWGWGNNSYAQSSISNLTHRSSPVQIGTLSVWTKISAGQFYTAGLNSDGTLWSWGLNSFGQLGRGDTTNSSSPVQVIGGSSDSILWKQIAGSVSNLMLTTQGTMWSCGQNSFGQLGVLDQTNRSSLVQIGTLSNWSQVSINALSAAAVKTDGTLWAWGSNASGQLGQSNITNRSSPVQVGLLSNWSQVVIGGTTSTFALQSDGTLWGWGSNSFGQLGTNTSTLSSVLSPIQIGLLSNWSQVSVGGIHTIATKTDGTLWVWGGNSFGQLGLSNTTHRSSPVQVGSLSNWTSISAGITQSVAVNSNNLYSWGNNSWGQLGLGDVTHRYTPVQVGALSDWSKVSCGLLFTTSLKTDGTLWAWGINSYGELSQSNQTHRSSPVQIGTLSNWTAINSQGYAAYNSLAINTNGFLWGSGLNTFGSLGENDVITRFSPVQIVGRTFGRWSNIATNLGASHTVAIATNGSLWSWGINSLGQLGLNDQNNRRFPVQIGTASNWTQSAGGQSYTVAINSAGELWSWGNNSFGQLGDPGYRGTITSPIQTASSVLWKQFACGYHYSIALNSNGTIWGWGPSSTHFFPVQISGTQSNFTQITAGGTGKYHAIKTNGTLWNADFPFIAPPAQFGVLSNWSQASCGYQTSGAITTNGTLWMWSTGGNGNAYGQMGLGDTVGRTQSTPIQVGTLSNWSKILCGYYWTLALKTDGTI
jgi:alpha-tubulin suppressor-like RCC1 family protein